MKFLFFFLSSIVLCLPLHAKQSANSIEEEDLKITELQELIVKPKREKYKKKGNPAYELMQEIRKKYPLYNPAKNMPNHYLQTQNSTSAYTYDFYEKIVLGLNDVKIDSTNKHLGFLKDYQTIAYNTGKPVVLLSLREKIGKHANTINPESEKETVIDRTNHGVDDAFDQENINKMLEDVLREIDIYKNDITLMQQRFVSPLSKIAGDYYHYSINDTVIFADDPRRFIELNFAPVNPESFGFNGTLYVADDSTRFIRQVKMRVPRAINLNYVDNIFITQEFQQDSIGNYHKKLDDMAVELRIVAGTPSFYGRRTQARNNFEYTSAKSPDHKIRDFENDILIDATNFESPSALWDKMRLIPLTQAEKKLSGIHDEIKKRPFLLWAEKIILILAKGYIGTGYKSAPSKFDFGPVNTFISYNTLEGLRLKVGGMTTASLSPQIFAKGYIAYGFRDHRWKYEIEGEYSFRKKKIHSKEFPIHSLSASHRYDVDMLGQHYLFTNADNVFLSIRRAESNLATYKRMSKLEYTLELVNNFSVVAGFRHQIQFASRFVPFVDGAGRNFAHYSQSSFFIRLRYAPGEVFYEGRTHRRPINMDAPVIQLTQEFGSKGFAGSRFTLNVTELSLQKRFWFSAFGYADIILTGGKIWSQVDYPALLWPNANLSYTIQPESYSLMNPMEFANDWYGALDLTYWLNGMIFNRIPYIKDLKLREIFTFKLLSGGLTHKNNPDYNENLFRFPYDSYTHVMRKTPYMEIGAGIDNILTIFRVDYVWRLTYRNLPGIDKSGLRIALHFSF